MSWAPNTCLCHGAMKGDRHYILNASHVSVPMLTDLHILFNFPNKIYLKGRLLSLLYSWEGWGSEKWRSAQGHTARMWEDQDGTLMLIVSLLFQWFSNLNHCHNVLAIFSFSFFLTQIIMDSNSTGLWLDRCLRWGWVLSLRGFRGSSLCSWVAPWEYVKIFQDVGADVTLGGSFSILGIPKLICLACFLS